VNRRERRPVLLYVHPGELDSAHLLENLARRHSVALITTDETIAASMAKRARVLVEGVYAWAAVGRHYEALLVRVAGTALEATA
jgi:hypothetical protein